MRIGPFVVILTFLSVSLVFAAKYSRLFKEIRDLIGERKSSASDKDPLKDLFQMTEVLGAGTYATVYKGYLKLPVDTNSSAKKLAPSDTAILLHRWTTLVKQMAKLNRYPPLPDAAHPHKESVLPLRHTSRLLSHSPFAIKKMRLDTEDKLKFAMNEIRIGRQLSSKNIPNTMHYLDFYLQKDRLYMITEFIDGRSLDRIHPRSISSDILLKISFNLIHTIHKLMQANICHADIGPSNIMLNSNAQLFLLDFGLAQTIIDKFGAISTEQDFQFTEFCPDISMAILLLNDLIRHFPERKLPKNLSLLTNLLADIEAKRLDLNLALKVTCLMLSHTLFILF
jgi:serine/threonine protein kinase